MLTFSRVLLFAFALAGLLYSTTVNSTAYEQAVLWALTVMAFLRAISSEPSSASSTVEQKRVESLESTAASERAECKESTEASERPRYTREDDTLDRSSGPRRIHDGDQGWG